MLVHHIRNIRQHVFIANANTYLTQFGFYDMWACASSEKVGFKTGWRLFPYPTSFLAIRCRQNECIEEIFFFCFEEAGSQPDTQPF